MAIKKLQNPFRANENEWLLNHIGRCSVVLETEEEGIVKIVAYSDNVSDRKELVNLAKQVNGFIVKNISEKGVNYIDKCEY